MRTSPDQEFWTSEREGGFREPLETVYKLLYEYLFIHGFTQESCDLKILTDPQRLLVALKDVASEGLTWSTF